MSANKGNLQDEIEVHLGFLMDPFGNEHHRRQYEISVQYLLAHADRAYPRLLQALKANPGALNSPAIIEVLPLFGRSDSVPVLEDIMRGGFEQVSGIAGQALGRHSATEAREALLRGLRSPLTEVMAAAADGLMVRGDASVCPDLKPLARHANGIVRYHAAQAMRRLGCLNAHEIEELRQNYPDLRDLF